MINKAILIGNVASAPNTKVLANGEKMASFSLATTETWKDAQGKKNEKTEWHKVVIFGSSVKIIESYVKKGSRLFIEGSIRTKKYTDTLTNEAKYTTQIVVSKGSDSFKILDYKGGDSEDSRPAVGNTPVNDKFLDVLDDDVPF